MIRRLACCALLGSTAATGGCLGLNEDFVEDSSMQGTSTGMGTNSSASMSASTDTAMTMSTSTMDESGGPAGSSDASESTASIDVCTEDPFEMNDDQPVASVMPTLMISEGAQFLDAAHVDVDEDWYRIPVVDDQITPGFSAEVDADLQICAFVVCNAGVSATTVWGCDFDAQPDVSPEGHSGCCRPRYTGFDFSCKGGGRDADVFVYVTATTTTPAGCVPYELRYEI